MNTITNSNSNNTIQLISSDSIQFTVDIELIHHSKTLSLFLDNRFPFIQSQTRQVHLPIKAKYLKRILDFMQYMDKRREEERGMIEFKVEDEETMDLLEIASYLRI